RASSEREQLDLEHERRARRDDVARARVLRVLREAALAVGELARDRELALAAHLHARDALVPALDDPALAEGELEGLLPVDRAVELLPVGEPARVVHGHGLAGLRGRALSDHQVLVFEPARGLRRRHVLLRAGGY